VTDIDLERQLNTRSLCRLEFDLVNGIPRQRYEIDSYWDYIDLRLFSYRRLFGSFSNDLRIDLIFMTPSLSHRVIAAVEIMRYRPGSV
jgi:hypothetical protein